MATQVLLKPAQESVEIEYEGSRVKLPVVHIGGRVFVSRSRSARWQVRVGVHVGPVIAGDVGHRKYQYDVWGDAVNTASRMEQAAAPGSVCVNKDTWNFLPEH